MGTIGEGSGGICEQQKVYREIARALLRVGCTQSSLGSGEMIQGQLIPVL